MQTRPLCRACACPLSSPSLDNPTQALACPLSLVRAGTWALDEAWRAVGHDRAIQGNLDPAILLTDRETVRRRAGDVLAAAAGRPGHIFNLGHGVHPQTPVENVLELIAAVKESGPQG